jgi:hypothetical protein
MYAIFYYDKFRHIPHPLVVAMTSTVDFHDSLYPLVLTKLQNKIKTAEIMFKRDGYSD